VSVAIGLCIAGIDRVSFWSTHVHESTVDAPLALDPGQRRTSDAWTFERTGAHASTATRRREVQMGQTRDHVGSGMAWGRYRLAVIGARVRMRTCIECKAGCSRAVGRELSQRLGGFIDVLPWQSSVHASGGSWLSTRQVEGQVEIVPLSIAVAVVCVCLSLDGKREASALEPFRQIHPTPPFPRSLLRDRSCSFFSLTSPTLPSALAQSPSCTMSSPDVKPLPFVYQFAAGESQCL
jgi:hypothetical protein